MIDKVLIELFLEDIARIEPIKGREDYLPHTRRIERGRWLMRLATNSFELTFPRVQGTLRKSIIKFNKQCQVDGKPVLIPSDFVKQVEDYLDNPHILVPSALAQCIGQPVDRDQELHRHREELGWRCFYLLALFPPEVRAEALTCQPSEATLKHFRRVASEYKASRARLIEGTLRYPLRIAVSYIGRGLPYLDLVQEGYFGLQHAVDRFVEREGAHFQQYASQRIHQRMMRAVSEKGRLIRVPVDLNDKIAQLKKLESQYDNNLVLAPYACDLEIAERLGLIDDLTSKSERHKGLAKLKKLRAADARHYSIERSGIDDLLVDKHSFEDQVESDVIRESIDGWLEHLPQREREIVKMRVGLMDGKGKTLEEIAQMYGLTRERIRQIEHQAHDRMKRSKHALSGAEGGTDHRIETAINDLSRLLRSTLDAIDEREALRPNTHQRERQWIEKRIEKRIMRGARRMTSRRGQLNRTQLFEQVLNEAGHPLHYTEIHQRALALLPPEQHFTKEVAYAKLFYDRRFRPLGGGVFSLVSWQSTTQQTSSEPVFTHCPSPLLPANAHPRAFLESILTARQLVQSQPQITVIEFYEEMLKKYKRDRATPQDAFDAWYTVGLHDYIQFAHQAREVMRLSIPAEWKLSEVRVHCLNYLCRRVEKMPELLAALERLAAADIATLQRVVFGSESAGYDVQLRLNMLAGFEAVRADGNNWRITEVGRAALQANPPQELPDLSMIEAAESDMSEADDWDDPLEMFSL